MFTRFDRGCEVRVECPFSLEARDERPLSLLRHDDGEDAPWTQGCGGERCAQRRLSPPEVLPMRTPFRIASLLATIAFVVLSAAGCGRISEPPTAPAADRAGGATPLASDATVCDPYAPYDPANFTRSTRIDNRFLPLRPGTQYVLEGVANRGGGPLPHRVVFTVTDVVKTIDGVPNVVVWDQDFNEGVLVESELAFFAQDDAGHVWSTGEYPEEYENGVFTGAPSTWITGVAGARAGTMMPASPTLGTSYYLQGYAPEIGFLDCGKVWQLGTSTTVPAGSFDQVLVTDEKSPLDHGGHQRKYYAPGIGNVQIGAVGDPEGETLVLTSRRSLSTRDMRNARRAVFQLEARAYKVSDVYRQTPPAR
jgi:hypothetical protein